MPDAGVVGALFWFSILRHAGNPAVIALALDRWLCVPTFRRVCRESAIRNMPNKHPRDKPRRSQKRRKIVSGSRLPDSVKALLGAARGPVLERISAQKGSQAAWDAWLSAHLPEPLRARISGVLEREGALIVFTESAAWSARLRFALAEVEPDVRAERPDVKRVVVKVMPRGG
jgi:hypothetical protein